MLWDAVIQEHLIKSGKIDGVALINTHGERLYSYGTVNDYFTSAAPSSNLLFLDLFVPRPPTDVKTFRSKEKFDLNSHALLESTPWWLEKGITVKNITFRVFEKTMRYGISHRKREGLVVGHVGFGVAVVLYSRPQQPATAIPVIESFFDTLRA